MVDTIKRADKSRSPRSVTYRVSAADSVLLLTFARLTNYYIITRLVTWLNLSSNVFWLTGYEEEEDCLLSTRVVDLPRPGSFRLDTGRVGKVSRIKTVLFNRGEPHAFHRQATCFPPVMASPSSSDTAATSR